MTHQAITTPHAPQAIGTYSQAIKVGNTVYLSGQIPLKPESMTFPEGDIATHIHQVFSNLRAVTQAAGGNLKNIVKLNVFLTNLEYFASVNQIMAEYFEPPYPARAVVGVATLPRGAQIEMDAILVLPE